ncbi:HAD family hydrolase [Actinokineospora bangkokensis]|uniref:HAD family hydrolase n=1 Tax=Actinokineospora bangkokensis TaxID=1193682 RepID=A0A1Q9LII3_9PSEU|nr:HAD family hydrolase [Actinokineospora bangkokensis]
MLDRYDALLFDLDGTVYRGGQALPAAADVVDAAHARGTAVRFVTNNASRAPGAVAEHLRAMSVSADTAEVSTSGQAAAAVLSERLADGDRVLVLGTEALADLVAEVGLTPVRAFSDEVKGVVQGLSPQMTWADLAEGALAIRAGALWVACNVDRTLPTERGLLPGNGSMVHALRVATDQEPVVAGKPATPLMRQSIESAGAGRPLVVGDRLDTDIEGAVSSGVDSLLVLTGVCTPEGLLRAGEHERPTYVLADLTGFDGPADAMRVGSGDGWEVEVDGNTVRVDGSGDPTALLRALCPAHWSAAGSLTHDARSAAARTALTTLGLAIG